jgi:hypothetical protein
MRNLTNDMAFGGSKSTVDITTLHPFIVLPIKHQFLIFSSLHHPNNHFESISFLFVPPQIISHKNMFLGRKNIAGAFAPPPPQVNPMVKGKVNPRTVETCNPM